MDANRLRELIDARVAPVALDVRSGSEYAQGHVPGAVNIPFWRIPVADIPASPDDLVIVYCGHGPRAYIARGLLRLRGFRRVAFLAGHMANWRTAGLPEESLRE
jgi:rhodanese-related sulfurtransferase